MLKPKAAGFFLGKVRVILPPGFGDRGFVVTQFLADVFEACQSFHTAEAKFFRDHFLQIRRHEGLDDHSAGTVASIGVAAAEPGFAYLMYSLLANLIAFEHPGAKLRGSNCQTEYARRFWARQPGGAITQTAPNEFRQKFGSTYQDFKESGEKVVQRLARSQGQSEAEARGELNRLGSNYFSAYYGVSMAASQYLGPALLPRPAAPRETIEAVRAAQKKTVNARDLAFIVDGTPDSAKGYLLSVPRGQTTFTPANLLARFNATRSYTRGLRDVGALNLYGRLIAQPTTPALDSIVQVLREYNTEVATERTKREVAKWVARGDALKDALAAAGITNLNRFFYYFSTAADTYAGRAARIAGEGKKRLNPRRDKLAVRIFMPV